MPKLTKKLPSYRLHKSSGQAIVTLNGRGVYLGAYDRAESRAEYDRLIAEWLANNRQMALAPAPARPGYGAADLTDGLTIDELFLAYWRFAESYYVKNARPTGELHNIRDAARPLVKLYGSTRANAFGPNALETVREAMIGAGLSRKVINARINRIRRMFRWGVSKQMIPASVLQALQALAPLKRGRCSARETGPVVPAAQENVEAVLKIISATGGAMIQLQQCAGMRPDEVVQMRACDLDRSGKVWVYTPESHKTEHYGRKRRIFLGPRAQAILKPYFRREDSSYLFSPIGEEQERLVRRNAARKTPMSCGNRPGTNRKSAPKRKPGDKYTVASYRRAIQRACDQAFPPPEHLRQQKVKGRKGMRWETPKEWRQRLGDKQWAELQAGQKAHRWCPNQLRHSAATFLRREYGLDAARVILGHSSPAVTEIYAELDFAKAMKIMGEVG